MLLPCQIIESVKGSNYQIACARYFELTHKLQAGSMSINHPNQYFEESQKARTAEKGQCFNSNETYALNSRQCDCLIFTDTTC